MPAQTTVFDAKCNPIADLGTGARNTIKWSPSSKLLCLGGFGNLAGEMVPLLCIAQTQGYLGPKEVEEDWLRKSWFVIVEVISLKTVEYSAYVEWSPDSRYIVTGITFPRMRVGNG